MAVTFGCPLVGTYDELRGKHLKVGQRAYATDRYPEHNGTNWKTGAVDEKGNLIVYESLPWDGDNEVNPSNYYTKEQVDDIVKDGKDIFTFTCNIIENPEMAGGFEIESMTAKYDEIENVYKKGKIIKAIGNTWDSRTFILDLVGIVNENFIFSGTLDITVFTLYLNSNNNAEAYAQNLQTINNMIQTIKHNEGVEDRYPSVKAVADYVAKYSGGGGGEVNLNNYYTKEEVNTLFVASDYYETRMATTDEKIEVNLQYIYDLQAEMPGILGRLGELEENVGDIAEATAAIIALQNKYIGGETA